MTLRECIQAGFELAHAVTPAATLVADPAWLFGDSLPGTGRGASSQYHCLSPDELARVRLPPLLPDCRLFLWRVAAMQAEALALLEAWGFTLKSELVWVKMTKHGKLHFGMGRQVRASHEVCLIATRGRPERLNASTRSILQAPLVYRPDGKVWHSAKPDAFYTLVQDLSPGPYCELFGRRARAGWLQYGKEVSHYAQTEAR